MWNIWTEDIGPDGKIRKVDGDINITSVRHFDNEITQRTSSGSCPSILIELIKLQKQIISASWNLVRQHEQLSDKAPKTEELSDLKNSQEHAVELTIKLEAMISDPFLKGFIKDARLEMKKAIDHLEEAAEKTSTDPLEEALVHEQKALRFLYQIMSNLKVVIIPEGGGGDGGDQEQKPKDDLDLKKKEKSPYEEEKAAQGDPTNEAIEALEFLKSIQRRLDQLQEQQSDLLTEVDNLKEKAKDQVTDEQKQAIESVRNHVKKSKDNLENKELGNGARKCRKNQTGIC